MGCFNISRTTYLIKIKSGVHVTHSKGLHPYQFYSSVVHSGGDNHQTIKLVIKLNVDPFSKTIKPNLCLQTLYDCNIQWVLQILATQIITEYQILYCSVFRTGKLTCGHKWFPKILILNSWLTVKTIAHRSHFCEVDRLCVGLTLVTVDWQLKPEHITL